MCSEIDGVKKFKDLSLDEKMDLFRYYQEGGEIEFYGPYSLKWHITDNPGFFKNERYRKKPKIVKDTKFFGPNNRTEVIFDMENGYLVRGIYTSPEGYTIVVRDSK